MQDQAGRLTERRRGQVLTRLSPLDLLWVAAVPGISEEFLFRGALIPATFPDWCAPALAGPQHCHRHLPLRQGIEHGWLCLTRRGGLSRPIAHVRDLPASQHIARCVQHRYYWESASCW